MSAIKSRKTSLEYVCLAAKKIMFLRSLKKKDKSCSCNFHLHLYFFLLLFSLFNIDKCNWPAYKSMEYDASVCSYLLDLSQEELCGGK